MLKQTCILALLTMTAPAFAAEDPQWSNEEEVAIARSAGPGGSQRTLRSG